MRIKRKRHGGLTKIAIACFAVNPGVSDYLVGLTGALRQYADVDVLTSDTIDPNNRALLGSAHYCFRRSRHLPIDIWYYIWRVLATRPDVLLVQAWLKIPLLEILVIWLFRAAGVRCVVTVHDVLPHEPGRWDPLVLRLYYGAFDALVAHSKAAQKQLADMGIGRPSTVIPHALLEQYNREPLSRSMARIRVFENDPGPETFVALFFGHVTRRKGALAFAQAAAHLPQDGRIKLVMAGQPDLSIAELQSLRLACEQSGVVFREGHVAFGDVQSYFTCADCVVIPYLEGTTSGVMKVAIAFEKPVVATPIGDVVETVDRRSAVIIPVEDLPAAIAAGIVEARARGAELASGIRALKSSLSWDEIGGRYAGFLAGTLTGARENLAVALSGAPAPVGLAPK